jgi:hypothetical protein
MKRWYLKMFEDFGCSQSDARFGHQVSFHDEARLKEPKWKDPETRINDVSNSWRLWEKLISERRMQIAALWRELQMSTRKTSGEMFPSDLREFNERDPDSEMSYVRTLVELNRDVCLSRWCLRAQGCETYSGQLGCRVGCLQGSWGAHIVKHITTHNKQKIQKNHKTVKKNQKKNVTRIRK